MHRRMLKNLRLRMTDSPMSDGKWFLDRVRLSQTKLISVGVNLYRLTWFDATANEGFGEWVFNILLKRSAQRTSMRAPFANRVRMMYGRNTTGVLRDSRSSSGIATSLRFSALGLRPWAKDPQPG